MWALLILKSWKEWSIKIERSNDEVMEEQKIYHLILTIILLHYLSKKLKEAGALKIFESLNIYIYLI